MNHVGERDRRQIVTVSDSSLTEYLDGRAYDEWANQSDNVETFDSYIDIGGVSIEL